jgi:tubulin beta
VYCGDNDAQLRRINVFNREAPGGKYVPRSLLFDLELGVIGAVRARRRSASSSARETS